MKNGVDVVTLVTVMGEIIGRVKDYDSETITLTEPRLFVQQDDGAGFAPGVCLTGEGKHKELVFRHNQVLVVVPTHPDLIKGWTQATSGIVLS